MPTIRFMVEVETATPAGACGPGGVLNEVMAEDVRRYLDRLDEQEFLGDDVLDVTVTRLEDR